MHSCPSTKMCACPCATALQSKQQITAKVHKAVEENSIKAQKALDDVKKKAAVDVKKVWGAGL